MKIFQLISLCLFLSLMACEPNTTSSQQNNNTSAGNSSTEGTNTTSRIDGTTARMAAKTRQDSIAEKLIHACEIAGQVIEGNQIWLKEANILVAIVADSTTYDKEYGESHRVLLTYNTATCTVVKREELPVNFSPDFPYYLATINYNNASQVVGIRGLNTVYIFNTQTQKLETVTPKFLSPRLADDAQSGAIQHLEVWEDYMVGYAEDKGVFVVDVTNKQAPEPLFAHAEYQLPNETFSSLFMLESEGNKQQAILPSYNIDADSFAINPLFEKPKSMNQQISKGARNNRYIILRESSSTSKATVVDMLEQKEINLPDNMQTKKAKDILNWLKKQEK